MRSNRKLGSMRTCRKARCSPPWFLCEAQPGNNEQVAGRCAHAVAAFWCYLSRGARCCLWCCLYSIVVRLCVRPMSLNGRSPHLPRRGRMLRQTLPDFAPTCGNSSFIHGVDEGARVRGPGLWAARYWQAASTVTGHGPLAAALAPHDPWQTGTGLGFREEPLVQAAPGPTWPSGSRAAWPFGCWCCHRRSRG